MYKILHFSTFLHFIHIFVTFPYYIICVHKDVTERLEVINPGLAGEIRKVLDVNKAERHLRGGMATREKYSHMRK